MFSDTRHHCSGASRTVPLLIFTTLYRHRDAIHKLGTELQRHNELRGTGRTATELASSRHARSSFVALTDEMRWLLPKFNKYKPSLWYAGVGFLVLRLMQTSLMALVRSQHAQAVIACCVTLVSASAQRELSPFRRASDNHVALLSQWLIFLWVNFIKLLLFVLVVNKIDISLCVF